MSSQEKKSPEVLAEAGVGLAVIEESENRVELRGKLPAAPEVRVLPSGLEIVSFRIVVRRADSPLRRQSKATVDTIDCSVWGGRVRRTVLAWDAGDIVAVAGALRRRFYRGPGGPVSRFDVEVLEGRRVVKAKK